MGFGKFYKSLLKGNYEFGRRAANMITEDMAPAKAKAVGASVDVAAGVGLTAIFGSTVIGWGVAAITAIAGIATAPATIPAAIGIVAGAALWGGLSLLMVSMGAGFMSSAMDKMNIPKPAAAKINYAAQSTAQTVTKPFKWVGNKLSRVFQKAHDGDSAAPKAVPGNAQPKAASYKV
jgi:hypothetical protein